MWYETFPSLIVMGVAMTVPFIFTYLSNRVVLGTPYKRYLETYRDGQLYLRDKRLSGENNPYKQINLDGFDP